MGFCPACAPTLVAPERPCARCGRPLEGPLCARCSRTPPPLCTSRAPLLYGGEVAVAIRRLKFDGATHLARPLADLMRPALRDLASRTDAVVPVPLHRSRLRSRGYNQAALLAVAAARPLRVATRHDLLWRVRDTRPQTALGPTERWRNVEGAFAAGAPARGRRLVLVDDVATTGATAAACARALLEAGAVEVHLLTLTRAMP